MKLTTIATLMFAAVMFTGCCGCKKSAKNTAANKPLVGTEWAMTQFEGSAFSKEGKYFILFNDEGRISGKGDCNRLVGNYTNEKEGALKLSLMASTMAFCPDQETENKFNKMLQQIDSYKIEGNLLFVYEGATQLAVFEARK